MTSVGMSYLRKMSLALEAQLSLRKLSLPIQLHKQREAAMVARAPAGVSKVRRRKKVGRCYLTN